jgi:hypothetical protein
MVMNSTSEQGELLNKRPRLVGIIPVLVLAVFLTTVVTLALEYAGVADLGRVPRSIVLGTVSGLIAMVVVYPALRRGKTVQPAAPDMKKKEKGAADAGTAAEGPGG